MVKMGTEQYVRSTSTSGYDLISFDLCSKTLIMFYFGLCCFTTSVYICVRLFFLLFSSMTLSSLRNGDLLPDFIFSGDTDLNFHMMLVFGWTHSCSTGGCLSNVCL